MVELKPSKHDPLNVPAGTLRKLDSAAMVVLYRNAPDNVPILFRGNENQEPYVGIFPRTTDLPVA